MWPIAVIWKNTSDLTTMPENLLSESLAGQTLTICDLLIVLCLCTVYSNSLCSQTWAICLVLQAQKLLSWYCDKVLINQACCHHMWWQRCHLSTKTSLRSLPNKRLEQTQILYYSCTVFVNRPVICDVIAYI